MPTKTYTAQEMRDTACRLFGEIGFNDPLVEHTVCKAEEMLRYAADMVERCEDHIKTMQECGDNMYSKIIEDILTNILRGDAGKEER